MTVDSWTKEEVYFTYAPANPSNWNSLEKDRLRESRPQCKGFEEARKYLPYFTKMFSEFLIDPKNKDLKITRVSIKTIYTENAILEVKENVT